MGTNADVGAIAAAGSWNSSTSQSPDGIVTDD
jgi:hypothetical protein